MSSPDDRCRRRRFAARAGGSQVRRPGIGRHDARESPCRGEPVTFDDAVGYHDHNWGILGRRQLAMGTGGARRPVGRVRPRVSARRRRRSRSHSGISRRARPGGPLGFSTNVTIDDASAGRVDVPATGKGVELQLAFAADETVRTAMGTTALLGGTPLNFFQLGGVYHVTGTVAGRQVDFTARGSAETFKPR